MSSADRTSPAVSVGSGHRLEERQIPVSVHGHYLVAVPSGNGPHPLLVGCHGYGETAADHLAELRRIPGSEGWVLCAVQGLSTFYRGRSGEVVASWMTRFNRERAIADNLRYVAAVVDAVEAEHGVGGPRAYAGFSQGVAMAYRAAARGGRPGAGVLALAGDVPPELSAGELAGLGRVLIGRGEGDEWYDAGKLAADLARLSAAGLEPASLTFAGGHEWTAELRSRAGAWLAELAAGVA